MRTEKIKSYRLGVSRTFPTTHARNGEPTWFVERICKGLDLPYCTEFERKIHTIRGNYELWKKRMDEVQAGEAVIELYYWEDKQVVFATIDKDSGCGVQELFFEECNIKSPIASEDNWYKGLTLEELSMNDGLSIEDLKAWFKGYDLGKPMAIIHFTKFRY